MPDREYIFAEDGVVRSREELVHDWHVVATFRQVSQGIHIPLRRTTAKVRKSIFQRTFLDEKRLDFLLFLEHNLYTILYFVGSVEEKCIHQGSPERPWRHSPAKSLDLYHLIWVHCRRRVSERI